MIAASPVATWTKKILRIVSLMLHAVKIWRPSLSPHFMSLQHIT